MGKFISPYGDRKFYKGVGRSKDKDIQDASDKYQNKVLEALESKVPTTLAPDYSNKELEKQIKQFYNSKEWKTIRLTAFESLSHCCPVCWAETNLVVDHIKPVRYFWEERLNPENLQILCRDCNDEKKSIINWSLDWHLDLHKKKRKLTEKYQNLYINENKPKIPEVSTGITPKPFTKQIRVVKKDGTIIYK